MNIIDALPKKTMVLALFLAALFIFLSVLLFFPKNPQTKQGTSGEEPTITVTQTGTVYQQPPVFRSAFDSGKNTYDLVFDVPEGFSLPKTIDNVNVDRSISDSYITFLKNKFNIQGDPIVNNSTYLWYSSDQKRSLQIDKNSGYIQFGSDDTKTADKRITGQQAETIAENYLQEFNALSITPGSAHITMLEGERELHETQSEAKVSLYEISYIESIGGTPIYYQFATTATISVLVDANGNIRGLRYFQIQPTQVEQSSLLSLGSVKERALKGEYTIVKISGDPESIPQGGTITINNASVILFDDKKNPSLYPTVLLQGTLQPSDREVSLYFSDLSN